MAETRVAARVRRLAGLPEPIPYNTIEGLTPQHREVIHHWFMNGCKSKRQACVAAGMRGGSHADVFSRPAVVAEIARRKAEITAKFDVTEDRIIAEFAAIGFSRLGDLLEVQEDGSAWIDMSGMTDEQKAALAEYHVETYQVPGAEGEDGYTVKKSRIKFHDKPSALVSLARIKGMMKDKLEIAVGLSLSDKVQNARMRLREQPMIEGEIVDERNSD